MAEIGERCRCGGRVGVVNTFVTGEVRVRYLGCRECGWRPEQNKQVLPVEYAPRRRPKLRRIRMRRRAG